MEELKFENMNKKLGWCYKLYVTSLVFCFVLSILYMLPLKKVVKNNVWIEEYVQISAHRGGALLNPENTKKAFDYVIKETSYTDIVEIDLRLTKDKVVVINHDGDINRMALDENEESIDIDKHTYSELLNYNLGRNFVDLNGHKPYLNYSIEQAREDGLTLMSLESFFEEYNEIRDFKVFLEIKESDGKGKYIVQEIIGLFERDSWFKDRSMIVSFNDDLVDYLSNEYSHLYVGALGRKTAYQIGFSKLGIDCFYNPKYEAIHIPYNEEAKNKFPLDLASKRMVDLFKKRNQLVVYWGIDNVNDMKRVVKSGAHVITTDRPDLLASLLGR